MPTPASEPSQSRTVARLAEEFHAPVNAVAALYEREWADLAHDARVTNFLHIFAVRKVEDALRERRGVGAPATSEVASTA